LAQPLLDRAATAAAFAVAAALFEPAELAAAVAAALFQAELGEPVLLAAATIAASGRGTLHRAGLVAGVFEARLHGLVFIGALGLRRVEWERRDEQGGQGRERRFHGDSFRLR